jgi:hypothetical protein
LDIRNETLTLMTNSHSLLKVLEKGLLLCTSATTFGADKILKSRHS